MNKRIAVFGHRKIDEEDKKCNYIENRTSIVFKSLIDDGDKTFLFGSKSEFDDLCYITITNFQEKYTDIERIGYLCANEIAFTEEEYVNYLALSKTKKPKLKKYRIYEEIKQFEFDGKNMYIERNKKIIDDADICIFYYKKENLQPKNKLGIKTNSGTKIALDYAELKNKEIIIIN